MMVLPRCEEILKKPDLELMLGMLLMALTSNICRNLLLWMYAIMDALLKLNMCCVLDMCWNRQLLLSPNFMLRLCS